MNEAEFMERLRQLLREAVLSGLGIDDVVELTESVVQNDWDLPEQGEDANDE